MKKQVELYEASLASKRLNYEMTRLATCGKHLKEGFIHPYNHVPDALFRKVTKQSTINPYR